MKPTIAALLCLLLLLGLPTQAAELPPHWQASWDSPAATDRPLQIVHGIDLTGKLPEGMDQLLPDAEPGGIARKGLEYFQQRGLGGIVCNVAFDNYLESEENWKKLITAVETCHDLGMVVWIYDELGYPSGAAGGLVLERNPEFEAQELAYDASLDDPFIVRAAYEHTHASNNYHAARRYANLIDDRAVACFINSQWLVDGWYARLGGSAERPASSDDGGQRLQPEDGWSGTRKCGRDAGHRGLASNLGCDRFHSLLRYG